MAVSMRQSLRLGAYLAKQKLARREKFPLVVELEPLFACNLACAGCGKIQYPANILKQRMPVETAVAAIEECGAPMVSIAGGEPLIHPEIHEIVAELIKRKKFVYLCTNALLMKKKMDRFKPSPYFAWAVHMDGLRERHDKSVCQEGVFDAAVDAIKEAKRRGFRVTTNTTFFNTDTPQTVREVLDYLNDDLQVDQMMISPAYAYEKAPDQEHFLGVQETTELLDLRLAEALLPDVGRLREDLQGAGRGDRLVQVRPRQRPALRQLHGALRLRAERGAGDHGQPEGVAARGDRALASAPRLAEAQGEPPVQAGCRALEARRQADPGGREDLGPVGGDRPQQRAGDPLRGDRRRPRSVVGAAAAVEEGSVDHPGDDHRHGDPGAGDLLADAVGEGAQPRLGGGVDRLARHPGGAGDRGHVDQVPAAALQHAGQQQPGEPHRRDQVQGDQPLG